MARIAVVLSVRTEEYSLWAEALYRLVDGIWVGVAGLEVDVWVLLCDHCARQFQVEAYTSAHVKEHIPNLQEAVGEIPVYIEVELVPMARVLHENQVVFLCNLHHVVNGAGQSTLVAYLHPLPPIVSGMFLEFYQLSVLVPRVEVIKRNQPFVILIGGFSDELVFTENDGLIDTGCVHSLDQHGRWSSTHTTMQVTVCIDYYHDISCKCELKLCI